VRKDSITTALKLQLADAHALLPSACTAASWHGAVTLLHLQQQLLQYSC
jgi:hypothetical protein